MNVDHMLYKIRMETELRSTQRPRQTESFVNFFISFKISLAFTLVQTHLAFKHL